jgi:hypothetical protein
MRHERAGRVAAQTLGFLQVYRYRAGKADWAAAGLPREGELANVPRVGDAARSDVPTCRAHEPIGSVRERVLSSGWDRCVVVDEATVALGLLRFRSNAWRRAR